MARFFISYARTDARDIAIELKDRLKNMGHEIFLDIQGIPGGAEWEKILIEKADWCDVLLLLITDSSNASKYVYQEFREAEKNNKFIIPIVIDAASIPIHLGKLNALPFDSNKECNYESVLVKIQESLVHLLPPLPEQSHLPVLPPPESSRFTRLPYILSAVIFILGMGLGIGISKLFLLPSQDIQQLEQEAIAFISSPLRDSSVPREIEVGGFYKPNSLLDRQLFVFVRPLNDRYYPQIPSGCDVNNRVSVDFDSTNNQWRLPIYVGSELDAPQSIYEILLMIADTDTAENLYRRFGEWCTQDSFPGLSESEMQQLGFEEIDSIIVTRQ